ncbi:hypothetical protein BDQ17DRAFT_1369467 [Cyathus striatus]|nr:hypothetical protein BDQ17DRAFT_1369467 [Cyathus striatus]
MKATIYRELKPTMSNTLTLNCYMLGDDYRNIFQAVLSPTNRVSDLIETIKKCSSSPVECIHSHRYQLQEQDIHS